MGIRFACHGCDKRLNVKRDLAGKRGVCPGCATRFRIPLQDTEKSTPIELEVEAAESKPPSLSAEPPSSSAEPPSSSAEPPSSSERAAAMEPVSAESVAPELKQDSAASIDLMADDPTSTWYVRPPTGGQYGPASSEVLRSWIDQGRVASTSLLWRDGWPQWRVASDVLPDLIKPLPDREPAVTNGVVATSISRGGALTLDGRVDVGAERRTRSSRRIFMIGILVAIAIALIVVLVIIVNRG